MPALPPPTLILRNIGVLLTMDPALPDPLGAIPRAAIVARGERILFAGPEAVLPSLGFEPGASATMEVDVAGCLVTPGLIDAHTHIVFAGDRSAEFHLRHAGASYEEIQARGGGIAHTVQATRAASFQELAALARARLVTMRQHGTTTVETKTGYGLERKTEERLLQVAAHLGRMPDLPRIVSTFLGAHVVPPEYQGDRAAYIALVRDEWLPSMAGQAAFCDVFCERTAFTLAETRSILEAARRLGFALKLHADQLSDSGGGRLAAEAWRDLCRSPGPHQRSGSRSIGGGAGRRGALARMRALAQHRVP